MVNELQRLLHVGNQTDIDSLADILHGLAEDRIIHELKEIFLGVGLGNGSELGVFVDLRLKPWGLPKSNDAMDLGELHPPSHIHLEVSILEDVLCVLT